MKQIIIVLFLIGIGSLQMIGDIFKVPIVLGIARATNVSPAPKVFTTQNGYETFSAKFFIAFTQDKKERFVEITPKNYKFLRGPYNRRNMYGAAISYAPVLNKHEATKKMLRQVLTYGFHRDSSLMQELSIESDIGSSTKVTVVPRSNIQSKVPFVFITKGEQDDK